MLLSLFVMVIMVIIINNKRIRFLDNLVLLIISFIALFFVNKNDNLTFI